MASLLCYNHFFSVFTSQSALPNKVLTAKKWVTIYCWRIFFALRGHSQCSSNTSTFSSQSCFVTECSCKKSQKNKSLHLETLISQCEGNSYTWHNTWGPGGIESVQGRTFLQTKLSLTEILWGRRKCSSVLVLCCFWSNGARHPRGNPKGYCPVNNKTPNWQLHVNKNLSGYHCKYGFN